MSSASAAPAQAAPQAFRPPYLALTTVGLALASFMQVLDTTIANVSLPTIAGNLGASANQATVPWCDPLRSRRVPIRT